MRLLIVAILATATLAFATYAMPARATPDTTCNIGPGCWVNDGSPGNCGTNGLECVCDGNDGTWNLDVHGCQLGGQ